jgi:hypothetical protein
VTAALDGARASEDRVAAVAPVLVAVAHPRGAQRQRDDAGDERRDPVVSGEEGAADAAKMQEFGIDVPRLRSASRPLTRMCLDWSEGRPHLGGALGAAFCDELIARGWIARLPERRIVRVTPAGERGLARTFNLARLPTI